MPDAVWTLLADPANRPMLALTLAGLVVIVFGPWAIVKLAQRRAAARFAEGGQGRDPFVRAVAKMSAKPDGWSRYGCEVRRRSAAGVVEIRKSAPCFPHLIRHASRATFPQSGRGSAPLLPLARRRWREAPDEGKSLQSAVSLVSWM